MFGPSNWSNPRGCGRTGVPDAVNMNAEIPRQPVANWRVTILVVGLETDRPITKGVHDIELLDVMIGADPGAAHWSSRTRRHTQPAMSG